MGVIAASRKREEPFPPATEAQLAEFTGRVATAVATAEAHAELTAWRARSVATADETRRRIERDLHDGAHQHLVSLALRLRAHRPQGPVEATGGTLGVESHPGRGTGLLVKLPID